jgi:hypothetical protein
MTILQTREFDLNPMRLDLLSNRLTPKLRGHSYGSRHIWLFILGADTMPL